MFTKKQKEWLIANKNQIKIISQSLELVKITNYNDEVKKFKIKNRDEFRKIMILIHFHYFPFKNEGYLSIKDCNKEYRKYINEEYFAERYIIKRTKNKELIKLENIKYYNFFNFKKPLILKIIKDYLNITNLEAYKIHDELFNGEYIYLHKNLIKLLETSCKCVFVLGNR